MHIQTVRTVSLLILVAISPLAVWNAEWVMVGLFNGDVAILITGQMLSTHLLIYFSKRHWASVYFATGIPFGLVIAAIALVALFQNLDAVTISAGLEVAYIAILYGGSISAIGCFCVNQNAERRGFVPIKTTHLFISLVPILGSQALGMHWAAGLNAYMLPELQILFVALAAAMILVKGAVRPKDIGELSLAFSIGCLVIYLAYISSEERDLSEGLIIALPGLQLGLSIYIISYFASFHSKWSDASRINAERANWHWLEVTAFALFMCFAPITLRESLLNMEDDQDRVAYETEMQERLAAYEERLSQLELELKP